MTIVDITIGRHEITVVIGDVTRVLPLGTDTLRERELRTDPPRPEELTNAIGAVYDHLDDVALELPEVLGATVVVHGPAIACIADVEVGAPAELPLVLSRDAAEDVFRTMATEPACDRRLNPGLAAPMVDEIVAGCCAVVAVLRRLRLDAVTVEH
jgi:exopolyphosphatase / guanosine-5'-triphosphate,3'-diphosphate pyrophosphatase